MGEGSIKLERWEKLSKEEKGKLTSVSSRCGHLCPSISRIFDLLLDVCNRSSCCSEHKGTPRVYVFMKSFFHSNAIWSPVRTNMHWYEVSQWNGKLKGSRENLSHYCASISEEDEGPHPAMRSPEKEMGTIWSDSGLIPFLSSLAAIKYNGNNGSSSKFMTYSCYYQQTHGGTMKKNLKELYFIGT